MGSVPAAATPWVMRTYSGHSSARASNELYRRNLAKGQTGLSVAFDLPTQTGYDPDHILARGEVGKVGVPVPHLGEMRALFDGIPIEDMNTSMTINATCAWLLGMYGALARERSVDPAWLSGTTQNDIVKEYLSRGTYIFPPGPSCRLTVDTVAYTVQHVPRWNPINVCSYHLHDAGAQPVQEIAFALATSCAVLDAVRESGQVEPDRFPEVVGRFSFFVNAGIRFIEEVCKLRAMGRMWDRLCRERYGVTDEKLRRFRYGVQVNSLGLTEAQPENNVQRIVLEMLGVTLSKSARARAVQLPCWNEALRLPRPSRPRSSRPSTSGRPAATPALSTGPSTGSGRPPPAPTTSWRSPSPWPRRAARLGSGPAHCATCSGSSGPRPVSAGSSRPTPRPWPPCGRRCGPSPPMAARPSSSSASPASTATPTAPNRSPSPPATPAWRSCTPASGC